MDTLIKGGLFQNWNIIGYRYIQWNITGQNVKNK